MNDARQTYAWGIVGQYTRIGFLELLPETAPFLNFDGFGL
jgi:hypothetical protein